MGVRSVLIIIVLLLTGCAAAKSRNQTDRLDSALREYGADMRWGRMNYAYRYHIDKNGQRPVIDLEALENYSVTDFKPVDPVLNTDSTTAVVPVEIDYYDKEYGTVRKIKTTQNWWYDAEEGAWFTESLFPEFK